MSNAATAEKPATSKMTKAQLAEALEQQHQKNVALQEALQSNPNPGDPEQAAPSTDARDTPVSLSKPQLSTDDEQIGQDGVVTGEDGSAEIARVKAETIDTPGFREKAANLEFNNEPVRIRILDTSEPNAQQVFQINVNGPPDWLFERGKEYTIPRYVLETIARAKPVNYRNEEYIDDDGILKVRWPSRTGARVPFDVIEDKNPMGRAWLRSILAQP